MPPIVTVLAARVLHQTEPRLLRAASAAEPLDSNPNPRAGPTNLLQSTLTRAVVVSAATTATAFGSMWLSRDPGMSSMGGLMALALACTLAAAVLFQPALMGPPRETASDVPPELPQLEDQRGERRREAAE